MQMQTFRFLNSSQGEELVNLGQFRVFTNKNISVCQIGTLYRPLSKPKDINIEPPILTQLK